MGRHLQQEHSGVQFQDYHPGCLWGVLQILDYHHWKIVPHRKHHGRRHAICCGNPKTISMDRDTGEAQSLLDAEAGNFVVEQNPTKVGPIDKRIKALITEEMSKEENHSHWFLGYPAQSNFQRTNSIHHLEPSDYRLGKINVEWANPIIILHKNASTSASGLQFPSPEKTTGRLVSRNKKCDFCDSVNVEGSLGQSLRSGKHRQVKFDKVVETLKNESEMDAKQLNREIFHHQVNEYADVLEIFKVNKELFLKILQDPDDGVSPGQQISNRKVRLTKSGSFPVADMSRVRYLRPSTLQRKQNETWAFPKVEKLVSSTQVPKPDAVRSPKGYNEKTAASLADQSAGSTIKQKTTFSSWGSSRLSNHQRWNRLIMGRLRDIRQRIKHAIKESKKERNKSNADGFLQRVPSTCTASTYGKEMSKYLENSMSQDGSNDSISCHETDGFDHGLGNSQLNRMRRTASLNESLDRYAQLFESSFCREAKLPQSKSLKLRNEDNISSRERAPKFFRRISSLSHLESFCSLINEAAHESEKAVMTEMECNTNSVSHNHSETKLSSFHVDADNYDSLDALIESEFEKNVDKESNSNSSIEYSGGLIVGRVDQEIARIGELGEDKVELANLTSIPLEDQTIDSAMNPTAGLEQSSLVSEPETCFLGNIINTAECAISGGSESNHIDEAESSFTMKNGSCKVSLQSLCSKVNHGKNSHLQRFESDNDEASFNYVKDVLQLSGFIGNESLGKWYSLDQPLDPTLFKEIEAYLHQEVQSSEEFGGSCDHQLLFNLINEVLLEMYDKLFMYFPRTFSFNHHIRPMPTGHHVLEEVWARICWYLSFRSELDRSLDDIVAQDLSKGNGWMNHQFETECVALEMEELIFDELLDEVIFS